MTPTPQQKRAIAAIRKLLPARYRKTARFSHVQVAGYVVSRSAGSISIAAPGLDAKFAPEQRRTAVPAYHFSPGIRVGDWVSCAYVVTPTGGEFYAVGYVA